MSNQAITTLTLKTPSKHNKFKRGDQVTIIKYKNSLYNIYKGYKAEVIKYNHNDDYIVINIEALYKHIYIPIEHLE
jgi:uncharacterized Zn ribbon protein